VLTLLDGCWYLLLGDVMMIMDDGRRMRILGMWNVSLKQGSEMWWKE
jgi:hypothetical protein